MILLEERGGNFYHIESITDCECNESGAITQMLPGDLCHWWNHVNSAGEPFIAWMWAGGGTTDQPKSVWKDGIQYASAAVQV